jgi:hypothetical protein
MGKKDFFLNREGREGREGREERVHNPNKILSAFICVYLLSSAFQKQNLDVSQKLKL